MSNPSHISNTTLNPNTSSASTGVLDKYSKSAFFSERFDVRYVLEIILVQKSHIFESCICSCFIFHRFSFVYFLPKKIFKWT